MACEGYGGLWVLDIGWVARVAEFYFGDVGVVVVLLLNCVWLESG